MKPGCKVLADVLLECFADTGELIEDHLRDLMISRRDAFCSYFFDIDVWTIRGLVAVFQADSPIWIDFRRAIQSHRRAIHWATLAEHVHEVGTLLARLALLQTDLSRGSADDRRRVAAQLNFMDGEIAVCRDMADRRDLAMRISRASGFTLIDGLTLRGLTYILGEHPTLWNDFQLLVENSDRTGRTRSQT
jgi:hypothetical protein